jgi:phosphatidylglycerol lysyltransferase
VGAASEKTFVYPRMFGAALPLEFLRWVGDATLAPHTRQAAWFLDSLYVISATLIAYVGFALFRPIIYRHGTPPHERATAKKILSRYGRSSLDYFKLLPDKAYFFSASGKSFVAYCVGANFAVALADPIGPPEEMVETIGQFRRFCEDNGWGIAFHQTLPDLLPIYRESGFKKLKIGDDAIVDLTNFTLDGKGFKKLRPRDNRLEKSGVRARFYDAPIPDDLIRRLKEVSDEWLRLPGRRERAFALGKFDPDYLRSTPIATAEDAEGRILAFANILHSYHSGEATPAVSFQLRRPQSVESKFASDWERRYLIYRHALDLPKVGVALGKVSELTE